VIRGVNTRPLLVWRWRLRVRRKSTATRRYVLGDSLPPSATLLYHHRHFLPHSLSPSFSHSSRSRERDRCRRSFGFFGRGTCRSPPSIDDDGAPSRGAIFHAETSRTLLYKHFPLPFLAFLSSAESGLPHPRAVDPPGRKAHAPIASYRLTEAVRDQRLIALRVLSRAARRHHD